MKEHPSIPESGITIKNIKAGSLYGHNLGIRSRYDSIDGVLSDSLFLRFLQSHGLSLQSEGKTRDLICLDFDFGSRSYEEEREHLMKLIASKTDPEERKKLEEVLAAVEQNKYQYKKLDKDGIRELFYQNGVSVRYDKKRKDGTLLRSDTIRYRMLYRNSSKAKLGQAVFIRESLYDCAYDWLTMGLGSRMPETNARIVELSAYAPLTASAIIGTLPIPVEDILILKDQDSRFTAMARVVRAEDYECLERVPDEEKTEQARQKALAAGKLDLYGNPIYKKAYKKVSAVKKRCVVSDEKTELQAPVWDGMALIEDSILPPWIHGMALLRQHFFKACAFRSRIQLYFKHWCEKNHRDYETETITDVFGRVHRMKDIKVITTDNAIKWKKFSGLMGATDAEAYDYWCRRVRADGSEFGVVKTDHPSKLGEVQQMSYQMINTLPCTREEIRRIAGQSMDCVNRLKSDTEEFLSFLRSNANEMNHYEMLADLCRHNPEFSESRWFRKEKQLIINGYVAKLRSGKITAPGDNLTVCGNPYALLLYSVGDPWQTDPTLRAEPGAVQCYTTRFSDGEYLCGMRSPHNSPNNVACFHNVRSSLMEEYFPFTENIIAVNTIKTDIQARCNGMDFDSDFLFVTNEPALVENARRCCRDYPTVVNQIRESGITYENTPLEYARMDHKFSKARRGIGESSNLAQLALSYYWTSPSQELYDNFTILAVLAQIVIDGCKREYEVDAMAEIERIKQMDCMNLTKDGTKCDLPFFMKYIKDVPTAKNGKELSYEEIKLGREKVSLRLNNEIICPMNWLQECLDQIPGASRTACRDTAEFFLKRTEKANSRQMARIRSLAEGYDAFLRTNHSRLYDETFQSELQSVSKEYYEAVRKIRIGNPAVFNRLIETALLPDTGNSKGLPSTGSRYAKRLLNTLYKINREMFLSNFVPGQEKNGQEKHDPKKQADA